VEFESELAGGEVPCPHCGIPLVLKLPALAPPPRPEPIDPAFKQTIYPDHILNAKHPFPWKSKRGFGVREKVAICGCACVVILVAGLALPSLLLIVGVAGGVFFYFIPTFAAYGKKNFQAIAILNLVAGWTFIGWVVALVWAATKDGDKK